MTEQRHALLVASYEYSDQGLRRLTAPRQDVAALEGVLRDPDIGGFTVRAMINRPAHEVARAVEEFYAQRRLDDLPLFYFSGHGLKDDQGRLYFAMTNTERRFLGATALPAAFVNETIDRARSRRSVMLLDCCYSGAFLAGRLAKGDAAIHTGSRFRSRGRAVLTASDSMQYAFEGDHLAGSAVQSVFTRLVVEGLRSGAADLNGDGLIDLDELYAYVDDRIRDDDVQQRPGKWQWDVQGSIVIARSGGAPEHPVPPGLREAAASAFPGVRLGAVDDLGLLLASEDPRTAEAARAVIRTLTDDADTRVAEAATRTLGSGTPPVVAPPAEVTPPVEIAPPVAAPPVEREPDPPAADEQVTAPAPDVTVTKRRRFRDRRRLVGAAVASGVVVVLGAVTAWVFLFRSEVDASVAVAGQPYYITAGHGSIWVGNPDEHTVSRIDIAAMKVVATISFGAHVGALSADTDAVWVADNGNRISRIDPRTNKVTTSIDTQVQDLQAEDDVVWVGTGLTEQVRRVNIADKAVIDVADVHNGRIAVGADAIWASGSLEDYISRIDRRTSKVTRIPMENPLHLSLNGDTLWSSCGIQDGYVCRVDTSTSKLVTKVHIGDDVQAIAADADSVWVAQDLKDEIVRINASTNTVVDTIRTRGHPTGIVTTEQAVWVSDAEGKVHRIDR